MGRKAVPTTLHILNGNPSKKPAQDLDLSNEVSFDIGVPDFPPHLSDEAEREWVRISEQLSSANLLTQVDRAALTAYCVYWAQWLEAQQNLASEGMLVLNVKGFTAININMKVAEKAMVQMRSFLGEFGLTPAARVRLKSPAKKDDDDLDLKMFG